MVDAVEVDFHNQRLRTVVAKPYDSEAERDGFTAFVSRNISPDDKAKHVVCDGRSVRALRAYMLSVIAAKA